MLCKKELVVERKRLPGLLKEALKKADYVEAVKLQHLMDFIDWMLDDNCECK